MFNYYAQNQDKGYPGMKADTTVDVVDSFASDGGVDPGEAVIRGTDPEVQVKAASKAGDIANVIGIAVHSHRDPNESGKYYEDGSTVSVMTFGDIYVKVGGSVTAGDGVTLDFTGDSPVFVSAGTSAAIPGMTYLESGSEDDIVAVRIRK